MSRESRKFKVPDEWANLYDCANSLDLRHFAHHGVQHAPGDEFTSPRDLGGWMSARGLLWSGAKITPAMLETALQLRSGIRAYLECDPLERRSDKDMLRALNKATALFPLFVGVAVGGMRPLPARDDAWG